MVFAATGHLNPVSDAITQKIIVVLAVLDALRTAFLSKVIHELWPPLAVAAQPRCDSRMKRE